MIRVQLLLQLLETQITGMEPFKHMLGVIASAANTLKGNWAVYSNG